MALTNQDRLRTAVRVLATLDNAKTVNAQQQQQPDRKASLTSCDRLLVL